MILEFDKHKAWESYFTRHNYTNVLKQHKKKYPLAYKLKRHTKFFKSTIDRNNGLHSVKAS